MKLNNEFISVIKKTRPEIRLDDVKIFDDGFDHIVYVINEKDAFRFPRRDDYVKILPVETAFLELFVPLSPIQTPKHTMHHLPDGKPFVSYTFIQGMQFTKSISETFSDNELTIIAGQLGKFLTALHSFPLDTAKELGIKELDTFDNYNNRFIKIKNKVYPHITEEQQKWVNQIFTDFLELVKKNPPKKRLTHSDIAPEHIIVDSEKHKLNGIIDFGDIGITDPAYDFTYLKKYGQNFLRTVYNNYELERDEDFEKRRQFYEDIMPVTNLEHSLDHQDKEKIKLHKKQLTDYINKKINYLLI